MAVEREGGADFATEGGADLVVETGVRTGGAATGVFSTSTRAFFGSGVGSAAGGRAFDGGAGDGVGVASSDLPTTSSGELFSTIVTFLGVAPER